MDHHPENLVRISAVRHTAAPHPLLDGPFVDKFFVAGALAAFIGVGYHGIHLWMILNGQMKAAQNYFELREAHVLIQEYLCLNLLLYGFLMQTTAKFYNAAIVPPNWTLSLIPLLLVGVFLRLVFPDTPAGSIVLALAPLSVLYWVTGCFQHGRADVRYWHRRFVSLGLLGLSVQPFFEESAADVAVFFFVLGVMPIFIAASQQFIAAFLGGMRLELGPNKAVFFLLLTASLLISFHFGIASRPGDSLRDVPTRAAGVILMCALVVFVYCTRLFHSVQKISSDPLHWSFVLGFAWAITAALLLALRGPAILDIVFHMWVLGWIMPIIIATSTQIVRRLTDAVKLSPNTIFGLVILWQIVPSGRSFGALGALPAQFSIVVAVAATIVLIGWLYALGTGSIAGFLRRLSTHRSCPLDG